MTDHYPFRDYEDKLSISHLDELHARRRELVRDVAHLRAAHGPFGKFDPMRKAKVSAYQKIARAKKKENKWTDKDVDAEAHTHDGYVKWLTDQLNEHAEMINIENEIREIDDRIMRETALIGWSRAELGLQR